MCEYCGFSKLLGVPYVEVKQHTRGRAGVSNALSVFIINMHNVTLFRRTVYPKHATRKTRDVLKVIAKSRGLLRKRLQSQIVHIMYLVKKNI